MYVSSTHVFLPETVLLRTPQGTNKKKRGCEFGQPAGAAHMPKQGGLSGSMCAETLRDVIQPVLLFFEQHCNCDRSQSCEIVSCSETKGVTNAVILMDMVKKFTRTALTTQAVYNRTACAGSN